jgi:hypothetical protein
MSTETTAAQPHRHKTVAGLLALLGGALGLHRLYLRAAYWWVYPMLCLPALGWALRNPPWYRHAGFFVLALVVVVSMAEAIRFSLTSDERWDALHNPASSKRSANRWGPVLIAILGLIVAAMLGMTTMAIALEGLFRGLRAVG